MNRGRMSYRTPVACSAGCAYILKGVPLYFEVVDRLEVATGCAPTIRFVHAEVLRVEDINMGFREPNLRLMCSFVRASVPQHLQRDPTSTTSALHPAAVAVCRFGILAPVQGIPSSGTP